MNYKALNPYTGSRRKNVDDLIENGEIGDFCFTQDSEKDLVLWLKYPPGQRNEDFPNVVPLPLVSLMGEPCWDFDGNMESPTLSPSILIQGSWHGYLREGKLIAVMQSEDQDG